jgi:hypothetical protein
LLAPRPTPKLEDHPLSASATDTFTKNEEPWSKEAIPRRMVWLLPDEHSA